MIQPFDTLSYPELRFIEPDFVKRVSVEQYGDVNVY